MELWSEPAHLAAAANKYQTKNSSFGASRARWPRLHRPSGHYVGTHGCYSTVLHGCKCQAPFQDISWSWNVSLARLRLRTTLKSYQAPFRPCQTQFREQIMFSKSIFWSNQTYFFNHLSRIQVYLAPRNGYETQVLPHVQLGKSKSFGPRGMRPARFGHTTILRSSAMPGGFAIATKFATFAFAAPRMRGGVWTYG